MAGQFGSRDHQGRMIRSFDALVYGMRWNCSKVAATRYTCCSEFAALLKKFPLRLRNDIPTERMIDFDHSFRRAGPAAATVLSDMDAELAALEQRRDKTRDLKQGMMQELLTGRIRLVHPGIAVAKAA
jgi:hypothetical protein